MTATTPTREHAEGMLNAILVDHVCGTPCKGTVKIGPVQKALVCPWSLIDLDNPADRRIVQGVYAAEARAAMPTASPQGGVL